MLISGYDIETNLFILFIYFINLFIVTRVDTSAIAVDFDIFATL
jgi:hypothetical protein